MYKNINITLEKKQKLKIHVKIHERSCDIKLKFHLITIKH